MHGPQQAAQEALAEQLLGHLGDGEQLHAEAQELGHLLGLLLVPVLLSICLSGFRIILIVNYCFPYYVSYTLITITILFDKDLHACRL